MRSLDKIILHCSATREGQDISADTIRKWHVEGNGWKDIGYHWVIRLDGTLEKGRPMGVSGAHTKGHNKNSVGICYIGGVEADGKTPKDTMTDAQQRTFIRLVEEIRFLHGHIPLYGHNEFSSKACPSFKVQEKFPDLCCRDLE